MAVTASNINVLNVVRSTMPLSYQDRVPEATQENINSIYGTLTGYAPLMNEVCNALMSVIVAQRIESMTFSNPLGVLKKEPMRYGQTEEEIFINMVKGQKYNQFAGASDLYAYYKANVMSAYHQINSNIQYPITITYDNLRNAFTSEYGIRDLINRKVESLFNSAEWDEYMSMRAIIESAYAQKVLYPVTVPDVVDEASAKALTVAMKTYIGKMLFPNTQFNVAGATSNATDSSIYYIVTPEIDAQLDTNVLAYAFHNDLAKVGARKIVVDKFENPAIKAVVFDMRFFNVKDHFRTLTNSENAMGLSWNYFYTVSEMFSYSPFFPCVVFTTDATAVTGVTAENASGKKGDVIEIKASVTGSADYALANLNYEVTGNNSGHTAFIPGTNRLIIGMDETATTLNVTVSSRYDSSIKGTATVTLGN